MLMKKWFEQWAKYLWGLQGPTSQHLFHVILDINIFYFHVSDSYLKIKVQRIFTIGGSYFLCYKATVLGNGKLTNFACSKVPLHPHMCEGKSSKSRVTCFISGGSVWRPPPMNPFINGMPDDLVEDDVDVRKGTLSITQRERLEDLLRNITPERLKVAEGMVFCIEHADAAEEICECILESLSNLSTALYKKVSAI